MMDSHRHGEKSATYRLLHRVQAMFVVAIVAPLGLAAWFAYSQVTSSLEAQAYERLLGANRFQSGGLVERLVEASYLLKEYQRELSSSGRDTTYVSGAMLNKADGVVVVGADGHASDLIGVSIASEYPSEIIAYTPENSRPVLVHSPSTQSLWIQLSDEQDTAEARPILAARLSNAFVFGNEHDQVLFSRFCIGNQSAMLHCSGEAEQYADYLLEHYFSIGPDRYQWTHTDGTEIYAVGRDVFLPSHFDTESWTVFTLEDASTVFAPIRVFRWLFPGLMALVALNVVLLVVRKTRQRLAPLSELQVGAHRLGGGDFDVRIDLKSGDELEELADSFNGMAVRLGNQFGFLSAMSEIDRVLLDQGDYFVIAQTIVRHCPRILRVELFSLLLLGGDDDTDYLYAYDKRAPHKVRSRQVALETTLSKLLGAELPQEQVVALEKLDGIKDYLPTQTQKIRVFPLSLGGRVFGALLLDEQEVQAFNAERMGQTQDVIGRLKVALSAVDRQQRLHQQAHYDELTGLPNRMLYIDRLEQDIRRADRDGEKVGVLYADLDRFKFVNDTLGHHFGDEVLKATAERLSQLLRMSDTVARISGDEFVFALPGLSGPEDIRRIAQGVVESLSEPFQIQNQEFHLDISIGVSIYPDDGSTAEELLQNADLAMYRAKAQPGSTSRLFEEAMNTEVTARYELGRELKKALSQGQLSLVYQPKVDTVTHKVCSAEALVRWYHPEHGWITPDRFIPIAEETGLITGVGEFALQEACRQLAQWQGQSLPIEQIAVNLSPYQVLYSDIVDVVYDTLRQYDIAPSALELEITENLLIDDYTKSEAVLARLKAIGVGLALDDFGTGYSSLSHLHRLSFDTLKVDRCFVDRVGSDRDAEAIVESILALGQNLGKHIVAEGLETTEQLAFLSGKGCDLYQGYYFSKPLAPKDMERILSLGQPLPLQSANEAATDPTQDRAAS